MTKNTETTDHGDTTKKRGKPQKNDPNSKDIVYKFGTWKGGSGHRNKIGSGPKENAVAVDDQIHKACQYKKDLTKIEQDRRKELKAALEDGEITCLQKAMEDARSRLEAASRAISSKRKAAVSEILDEEEGLSKKMKKRLAKSSARRGEVDPLLDEELKDARSAFKSAVQELRITWKEKEASSGKREGVDELAKRRSKELKTASGLYWGTEALVNAASRKSSASTPLIDSDGRFRSPRWGDEHKVVHVSVQIQHGKDGTVRGPARFKDLFVENQVAWIEPVSPMAWDKNVSAGQRKKLCRTYLHMAVDSYQIGPKENRRPTVMATFPIVLHRPIPDEAKVKRITMTRRLVADKHEWTCEIGLELPEGWKRGECGSGPIAVAIGWTREEDGGILVATAMKANGYMDVLRIPGWKTTKGTPTQKQVERRERRILVSEEMGQKEQLGQTVPLSNDKTTRIEYPNGLRSVRDQRMEELKETLSTIFKERPMEEARYMQYWRKPGKFVWLAKRVREQRPGSPEAEAMETWRKRDKHLWTWEVNQKTSALRSRKDLYRRIVSDWLKDHGQVIIDDTNYSKIARKKGINEEDNRAGQSERTVASPSELRTVIQQSSDMRGALVTVLDADKKRSRTCPNCKIEATHEVGQWFECHHCSFMAGRSQVRAYNMMSDAGFGSLVVKAVHVRMKQDQEIRKMAKEQERNDVAAE